VNAKAPLSMFLCQGAALDLKQERGVVGIEVFVDMPGAGSRPTVSKPHGLRMSFMAVHSKMNGDGAPGSGTHHAELNSVHKCIFGNKRYISRNAMTSTWNDRSIDRSTDLGPIAPQTQMLGFCDAFTRVGIKSERSAYRTRALTLKL